MLKIGANIVYRYCLQKVSYIVYLSQVQIDYHKRIFGLDFLRAIAILSVLFAHLLWIFPEARGWIPTLLQLAGILGVELFFVLSGFLIGRMLLNTFSSPDFHRNNLRYFIIRRWFRTLPNYYLILLINIALVFLFGRVLPESLWKYFLFFQNAYTPMDTFFRESWTLPIEEAAYLIGPILLFIVSSLKLKGNPKNIFLAVILLVISIFIGTKMYYSNTTENINLLQWNTDLKAVVLYRVDAIYYGFLAAYCSIVFSKIWNRFSLVFAILGSLLLLGFQYILYTQKLYIETYPELWNVLYLPFCSICIALLFPLFSKIKTAPSYILKPFTFISITSYSLYLLHYSIILQGMQYIVPAQDLGFSYKIIYAAGYFIILFIAAYVLYRFYEKPMMDLRDRPYFKKLSFKKVNQPNRQ